MKILLVDDDAFLRDMYATKFGENGHEVEVALTGEQAVQLASEHQFDVMLLDMIMPGITGVEVLKAVLKQKKENPPTVVVLSNQGGDEDIDAAMKAGAKGYIVKAEMIPSDVVKKVEEIVS